MTFRFTLRPAGLAGLLSISRTYESSGERCKDKVGGLDKHQAGFQAVTVTPFEVTDALQDLFLYAGKHRPRLYLDAQVRANISSFASLAADAELQEGLAKLTADLHSGDFAAVQAAYATPLGDYAFVCAYPALGQSSWTGRVDGQGPWRHAQTPP